MDDNKLPSIDLLRQLLRYEPDTGKLYWRFQKLDNFTDGKYSAERKSKAWNQRFANKEAFASVGNHGYFNGGINYKTYLAHRIIWAIQTGDWPNHDIDHLDGDRKNNRWKNLRSVTHAMNLRNARGKCTNKSGFTGVNWRKSRSKWRARIMIDGVDYCLGHFNTKDAAIKARTDAMRNFGFTARHGILGVKNRRD